VVVQNQFMPDGEAVTVGAGEYLCPPTDKSGSGIPPLPTLRCFAATSPFTPGVLTGDVADQFGVAEHTIGALVELCVPASKVVGVPPAPEPYYACYDSPTQVVQPAPVFIENQFGPNLLFLGDRVWVCVPSLKEGAGSTESYPTLTCYGAVGDVLFDPVGIETQFGFESPWVEFPDRFCTEAIKSIPTKLTKPGDTDGDGCPDAHENRPKAQASQGGGRDWQDPNDYYDVYGPGQSLVLDGFIDLPNDILGVIQHFAPQGTEPEYDVRFDRGVVIGANHWQRAGPDGVIDLPNDILGIILQFAHNCV